MVRFAARAQQPAALNDVIEATTSELDVGIAGRRPTNCAI